MVVAKEIIPYIQQKFSSQTLIERGGTVLQSPLYNTSKSNILINLLVTVIVLLYNSWSINVCLRT